jgi:hypothetical protein
MEIRQVIEELRLSVEQVAAEDELLGLIADRLIVLRQSFSSHRSVFTPCDIEFLKSLTGTSDHLRAFVELKEELLNVGSLEEYEDIVCRLTDTKGALARLAVAKRIGKEIRELNDRLPAIQEQDRARLEFRSNARILDLEENPAAADATTDGD